MLRQSAFAAALALLASTAAAAQTAPSAPPVAPVKPVQNTYFGTTVTDPYRWMENLDDPAVKSWFRGQADYTSSVLARIPGRAALLARIHQLDSASAYVTDVQEDGPYVFYEKTRPQDDNFKLYVRRGVSGPERVLFDPTVLTANGVHTSLDYYTPSQNGSYVAYGTSPGGSEDSTLHVLVTATGKTLPDAISRAQFDAGTISWLPDGHSFLYNREQKLAPGQNPADKESDSVAYLHKLGADPDTQDIPVLGKGISAAIAFQDADVPFLLTSPGAPGTIFATNDRGVQNEIALWTAPLASLSGKAAEIPWTKVCDFTDDVNSYDVQGDRIYLLSHKDAPHFQVLETSLTAPDIAHARVLAAADKIAVAKGIGAASDALYVHGRNGAVGYVTRIPYDGAKATSVRMPFAGALDPTLVTDPRIPGALLYTQSGAHYPVWLRYDPATTQLADTHLSPKDPADFSRVTLANVQATAPDGTPIPLSVMYPKGMKFDGSHPTLMLGYGAYGISTDMSYFLVLLAWVERGGVAAIAHVRGGGEEGQDWYQAGYKATKPNTWRDFIACGEYLVNHGYTSPAKLAGEGVSAGGILVSRAVTERPDLWGAALIDVGLSNMLRTEFTPNGPDNVPEFGSVTTEQGFRALYAMDGFQHVKDGVHYPAVMLTTGINDPRVASWEPGKMTARLQAATASGKPVLLRVDYDAGHGFGSTKSQDESRFADEWSFLLWQFGDPGFQPKPVEQAAK